MPNAHPHQRHTSSYPNTHPPSIRIRKLIASIRLDSYREIREGIIRCILATDMARHNEILTQFQEISPNFDYTNESHINLVSETEVTW